MKKAFACFLCLILTLNFPAFSVRAVFDSQKAEILNEAGLIAGTENGIAESRLATRAEIAAVTVRLLGGEQEAFEQRYSHPFLDVADWADAYIGYLYHYKITYGTSASRFSPNAPADENQFASFVLRALGYLDYSDGFTADNSTQKSVEVGILLQEEAADLSGRDTFTRGDMMNIMYNSLFCKMKGSGTALLEKLYRDGAVSYYSLLSMAEKDTRVKELMDSFPQDGDDTPKTPEELRALANQATVTVEMGKDANTFSQTGSGFLVDSSGLVLTTYQNLVEGCLHGRVSVDGKKYYPVEKIVGYNADSNIALLKIKTSSSLEAFPVGDIHKIENQQTVYFASKSSKSVLSFTEGKITKTAYLGEHGACIETNIPAQIPGGVLLNAHGEAVAFVPSSDSSSLLAVSAYKNLLK